MFVTALFTIFTLALFTLFTIVKTIAGNNLCPSIIKNKESLPFGATWMELEGIKLSEISQTEEDKYCMISLLCGI